MSDEFFVLLSTFSVIFSNRQFPRISCRENQYIQCKWQKIGWCLSLLSIQIWDQNINLDIIWGLFDAETLHPMGYQFVLVGLYLTSIIAINLGKWNDFKNHGKMLYWCCWFIWCLQEMSGLIEEVFRWLGIIWENWCRTGLGA